jgi:hypothetical protein
MTPAKGPIPTATTNISALRNDARHRGRGGGIGQTLCESIRSFQYAETAAQVIIVVATVVAIDMLSARIRKHLV